ncbi:hypothetical protein ACFXPS_30360 [Nocardia sp. NPDC059091]|uniref:hypothetical protein n=1 Tax=unclassified Nocardia TaxID=2637762 RepID=UPI003694AD4D
MKTVEIRAKGVAAYQRRNFPPEKVAEQIVDAVRGNRPMALVTLEAYVFRAISRISTRVSRQIARVNIGA